MGYFPRSAAANEQIFLAGLVELLAAYPTWVQDAVSNVRSGLPARHQFMPSIAEVRDYCEKLIAADRKHRELLDQWNRPRLPPPVDRSNRPTCDELKAKYGPNWGINPDKPPDPQKDLADLCAQAGVNPDHIPDAKREKNARRLGQVADKIVSTLAEKIDDWDVWP
jgi:hypothetical protein